MTACHHHTFTTLDRSFIVPLCEITSKSDINIDSCGIVNNECKQIHSYNMIKTMWSKNHLYMSNKLTWVYNNISNKIIHHARIVFCSIGIFLSEDGDKNVNRKMHKFVSGHSF